MRRALPALGAALVVGLAGCSGGSSGPTSSSPAATASDAPASTTSQAVPSSSGPSGSASAGAPSIGPSAAASSGAAASGAAASGAAASPAAPSLIPAVYCGLVTPGELAAYGITVPPAVATPVTGEGAHCAYGTLVTFDVVRSATEGAAHTAYQALVARSGIPEGGAVSGADEARLGAAPGGRFGWVLRRGRLAMALALPASAASAQTAADGTAQATMLKSAVLH